MYNISVCVSSQRSEAEDSPASVYETDEEESDNVRTIICIILFLLSPIVYRGIIYLGGGGYFLVVV